MRWVWPARTHPQCLSEVSPATRAASPAAIALRRMPRGGLLIAAIATLPRPTALYMSARAARSRGALAATAALATASDKPAGDNNDKKKRTAPSTAAAGSKRRAPSPPLLEPDGWRDTWDLIVELRADRTAVVDSMGTEAISAASEASVEEREYQTLISLMLSSQTKDTVNMATMLKLRAHGCTLENILATPDETLHELIKSVGFHNNKVRYIKDASAILKEKHGGRVPSDMESLLELPGVGPKMSLILLSVCFGKVEGISVDTHGAYPAPAHACLDLPNRV